jgi:hypothetical protein
MERNGSALANRIHETAHASIYSAVKVMKAFAGKILELVGLMVVLSGFLFGFHYNLVRFELGALAAGCAIFYFGWLLEKR